MLPIVGSVIVFISMLGGFIIAGGNPVVLLHISEFVVICGMAMGVLVIASPSTVIKNIIAEILDNIKGGGAKAEDYLELRSF